MTAVTVGRWTNIVLGAAVLGMVFAAVRGWRQRSAGNRFLWAGVSIMMVNVIYGSAEQLAQNSSAGWRTAVTTVGASYLLASLILKWRGRWHENDRPHGGVFDSAERE